MVTKKLHNISVNSAGYNQHYVSQFLLHGFHTGNEAQIWTFDKITGRSFTTAIDKGASEHGFYNIASSAEIDDVIQKVENAAAPIIEDAPWTSSVRRYGSRVYTRPGSGSFE